MRCPQCGTDNPPGKIVCRNCGTRLRAGAAALVMGPISEQELMSRVRWDMRRLAIDFAIVIAAGAILGYVLR